MRRLFAAAVLFLLASTLEAQQVVQVNLDSKILGEERLVLIKTPPSYGNGAGRYPVIYMTDGPSQLFHTAATIDFLARQGRMPEVIVVGIGNTDRTRDLTPTHVAATLFGRFPTSGGADKFLSFIETELIPYVEKNYRTQPYRAFAGHSFGGLLALHALMSRPKLFNSIIAVSPTLVWDDNLVTRRLPDFLRNNRDLDATLFLTTGNEGEDLDREVKKLRKILSGAPKSFEWHTVRYDDEDHGSVVLPSHLAGLKKVFEPWRFPINTTDDPAKLMTRARDHYAKLSKRAGYTIPIPEVTANLIGYRLLQANKLSEAIEVFKSNAEAYPDSANVFDSLGEAYERQGSLDLARENYERAARIGKENGDPNTQVYEQNRDRVSKNG